MARKAADKIIDYRRRKQEHELRPVQLWAHDWVRPEFRKRMRRKAELVRSHLGTLEANAFLGELLDEALADHAVENP
ncbi:MAG TPA: antitoxin MazE-like protein [Geminicoccaceae bacterium]|jgi:hypothetical protein|nr:antitoxin MazE-like protein [Geminicoccaceae bacterium]